MSFLDFYYLKNFNEFINSINIYGSVTKKKFVPFTQDEIFELCLNEESYKIFTIPKKSGGARKICAPIDRLKLLQLLVQVKLNDNFIPNDVSFGFIPGRSVVDNAKVHLNQNYVFNADIKDFFPSIKKERVEKVLRQAPFLLCTDKGLKEKAVPVSIKASEVQALSDTLWLEDATLYDYNGELIHVEAGCKIEDINYLIEIQENKISKLLGYNSIKLAYANFDHYDREVIGELIAQICTYRISDIKMDKNGEPQMDGTYVLPQGAPTSPILTNIVCQNLDRKLNQLAFKHNLKYSRYADDITFSGEYNAFNEDSSFRTAFAEIIKAEKFRLNSSKTRIQKRAERQEVTGVTVNEIPNTPKRYVKELRHWLYTWERYGLNTANELFLLHYGKTKGHIKNPFNRFTNVICGKLNYLKMVKGENDSTYCKLNERFKALLSKYNLETPEPIKITVISKEITDFDVPVVSNSLKHLLTELQSFIHRN